MKGLVIIAVAFFAMITIACIATHSAWPMCALFLLLCIEYESGPK